MATFERVLGKKTVPLDSAALSSDFESVLIDLGTGQGKFVLDAARRNPTRLVVGIDAVAQTMAKSARKAGASPKKGGLPNVLFVRATVENLPGPFEGRADTLTVQYPWGSLMRTVSAPATHHLKSLRAVCKLGARLTVYLNHSIFEDRNYLERLGMEDIADPASNPGLPAGYAAAGFDVTHRGVIRGDPPARSAWGRHLIRGSARATLVIDATARD